MIPLLIVIALSMFVGVIIGYLIALEVGRWLDKH